MLLTDLWHRELRIIEIDAADGALGSCLGSAGYTKYLAVAHGEQRRRALAKTHAALDGCVTAATSRRVVRHNNADVLILNGWSGVALGRFRSVRHAQYVALPIVATPLCWLAVIAGFLQWMVGRLAWPKLVRWRGSEESADGSRLASGTLLVFRVRRPRPNQSVRRFIPHRLGVAGFLRQLEANGVRHAVLRWFEDLPQWPIGEDVDLLVDDRGLESVCTLLDDGPGIQPIDVYSVTGLPGADFRAMPYFPPYLAEELLDRAVVHAGICRVPALRENFLSLAYHALYHKGARSGLPYRGKIKHRGRSDHDYAAALRQLAVRLRIDIGITLEDIDGYLDSQGWRPPHDMLVRLARRNPWVRSLLAKPGEVRSSDDRLAVFLIREQALHRGGLQRAAQFIEGNGFRLVATRSFDAQTSAFVGRSIRGGNWGRGPWPVSGGPPVAAIVVCDPAPITPTRRQRRRFPFLANARLLCKEQLRDAFNAGFPADEHCNVVHSSDNGREALDYLRIIMPEATGDVLKSVESNAGEIARAA